FPLQFPVIKELHFVCESSPDLRHKKTAKPSAQPFFWLQGHAATFTEHGRIGEKVGYNGKFWVRRRRYSQLDYAALFLGGNDGF
ncbi:MAG: hypothetical protein VCE75_25005, partial [Alphaproteobacteria bacterium]